MRFKRFFALFCALIWMSSATALAAGDLSTDPELGETQQVSVVRASNRVVSSTHNLTVNGTAAKPQAYNIDGYNYFKLRDIAYLLSGSTSTFEVEWDNAAQRINLVSGAKYTTVGGEMSVQATSGLKVQASTVSVRIDGSAASVSGFNINGNNYYKIADLSSELGFAATFDEDSQTVRIVTPEPEPEPEPKPEPEPEPIQRTSHLDGKMTVILDAGHGGSDIGAKHPTLDLDEKRVNLYVARYLRDMLEAQGVEVIMVRDSLDSGASLSSRGTVMEKYVETVDLFFGIHHNAANTQARGAQVLAQVADKNGGPSKLLANELEGEYAKVGLTIRPTWFREGSNGDYYYTNRFAAELGITAVISEYCFIDNDEDVLFIDSDADWRAEAQAQCNAIIKYFSQVEY